MLVALFDPAHLHHEAAHQWFGQKGKTPWATCPLTVNGCLRVLSRIAATTKPVPLSYLAGQLQELLQLPGRVEFITLPALTDGTRFDLKKLRGANQLTDSLLLAIAVENQGKLLTFDRNIPWASVIGARPDDIEILRA